MPLEQILENVGAKISDVRAAVDRRPAGVHLHRATGRIERPELFELAGVGVEETQRHVRAKRDRHSGVNNKRFLDPLRLRSE